MVLCNPRAACIQTECSRPGRSARKLEYHHLAWTLQHCKLQPQQQCPGLQLGRHRMSELEDCGFSSALHSLV